MRYLSLFSGIEAATVAWHEFGEPVAFSEIEPFPCAVLEHHYPEIPNLGDVTKITEEQIKGLGQFDLVVFGSPCQDLSIAGKRQGFTNEEGDVTRSGLFTTAINIIQWARKHNGCRFALWENVPGAFSSSKGADFASVVGLMAGLDDVAVPVNGWGAEGCAVGEHGMLEWSVLDAQWFGVAQRRRRVFALVDFGDWTSRFPILLESHSLRGDSAPSREKGEGIAPTVGTGAPFSRTGNDRVETEAYIAVAARMAAFGEYVDDGTSSTVKARDYKDATDLVYSMATKQQSINVGDNLDNSIGANDYKEPQAVIYALAGNTIGRKPENGGNGADYDESGVGYTLPKTDVHGVAYSFDSLSSNSMKSSNPHSGCRKVDLAKCLDTTIPCPSKNQGGIGIIDNIGVATSFQQNASGELRESDVCYTLNTNQNASGRNTGLLRNNMQVRRLTPVECARLQGFPDNYLDIDFRSKTAANSNKYKALGNSMAVPVMRWIGKRIHDVLNDCHD